MNRAAISVAMAFLFVLPAVAHAHALGVEAKLKDGKVVVEAFYDDDTPAEGAKVVVTGPGGMVVAEGKTDKTGTWVFAALPAGRYKVVVDGGAGHKGTVTLTVPDAGNPTPAAPGAASAPDDAATVSEGPTRSEFTGPMRMVWAAVGLAVIGGATWALTRASKLTKGRSPPNAGA